MSNGVFGSVKPANLDIENEVELLYSYMPSRGKVDDEFEGRFKKLDASKCLSVCQDEDDNSIDGLFTLKLPLNIFNKSGIYTIYVRPKEFKAKIYALSTLSAYPDIKGIVFNTDDLDGHGSGINGYRIEIPETGNGSNKKYTRIIRSCNYCSVTTDGTFTLSNSNTGFVFCVVTPNLAPDYTNAKTLPMGAAGEEVTLANTKFTPKMVEVEITEHDIETLSYMLEGSQVSDNDNGIITTFNKDGEIYHQARYTTVKDKLNNPLYTVKRKMTDVQNTTDYKDLLS